MAELTDIMRQQSGSAFAQLLSRLRVGAHTSEDVAVLQSRQVIAAADDTTYDDHPHLFALNADVDTYNARRLETLSTRTVSLRAKDKWPADCKDHSTADTEKKTGWPGDCSHSESWCPRHVGEKRRH